MNGGACCCNRSFDDTGVEADVLGESNFQLATTSEVVHLPIPDEEDESEALERARFKSELTVEDVDTQEGIVTFPTRSFARSSIVSGATLGGAPPSDPSAAVVDRRPRRIGTTDDVFALETWWGVSPLTPHKRMEEAMPGHTAVTEVVKVMCIKSEHVSQSCPAPLIDECLVRGTKYFVWQMKIGSACLVSLHQVMAVDTYEKIAQVPVNELLQKGLKLIVTPVNLKLSVPAKGPKDAETIGAFFGAKNVSFSRQRKDHQVYDVGLLTIDLYSVWSLKMLLPSLAFKEGRMADYHLVSYRDHAVLASYRSAVTQELIDLLTSC